MMMFRFALYNRNRNVWCGYNASTARRYRVETIKDAYLYTEKDGAENAMERSSWCTPELGWEIVPVRLHPWPE